MSLTFRILSNNYTEQPSPNTGYLRPSQWDDFSFKTLFTLTIYDENVSQKFLGSIKIGFSGQKKGWTSEEIPENFTVLPDKFYSIGQDADYYRDIIKEIPQEIADNILTSLGDVAYNDNRFQIAKDEAAFNISLLRFVNISSVKNQFRRILRNEAELTSYDFFYEKASSNFYSGVKINFTVEPSTKPPTNIHILIGRNGVGKTTILNNMVNTLVPERSAIEETGRFASPSSLTEDSALDDKYFAGVVSISFSAFDPFLPPKDQSEVNNGMRYYYVGLKKYIIQEGQTLWRLKDKNDLCSDFTRSLNICFALTAKKKRWLNAVRRLESDFNFAEMDLCQLVNMHDENPSDLPETAKRLFIRMSSGHSIVLLTLTKLVETVEEKTLVLLDEPESHLHPPLLSAFTRALSDLLVDRNGVAIIATHSPVVLQEVPKSCVSIIRRTGLITIIDRPERETFAENVGILTREVFGLEVSKSGFHELLTTSVAEGKSYEEIELEYKHQLGFEGKTILRAMISSRDSQSGVSE